MPPNERPAERYRPAVRRPCVDLFWCSKLAAPPRPRCRDARFARRPRHAPPHSPLHAHPSDHLLTTDQDFAPLIAREGWSVTLLDPHTGRQLD